MLMAKDSKSMTFEDFNSKINEIKDNIDNVNKNISEIIKSLQEAEKKRSTLEKQLNNTIKLLPKIFNDNLASNKKNKKIRTTNTDTGINKPTEVPEILIKFLNLDENATLPRTEVTKMLYTKFNDLGLKQGQYTVISSDIVNCLELDNIFIDKKLKIQEFQTFLASFYPKKVPSTLVTFLNVTNDTILSKFEIMKLFSTKLKSLNYTNTINIQLNNDLIESLKLDIKYQDTIIDIYNLLNILYSKK